MSFISFPPTVNWITGISNSFERLALDTSGVGLFLFLSFVLVQILLIWDVLCIIKAWLLRKISLKFFTEKFHWKIWEAYQAPRTWQDMNLQLYFHRTVLWLISLLGDFRLSCVAFLGNLTYTMCTLGLSMDLKGILSIFWCLQFVETSFPDFAPKVCSSSGSSELRSLTQQPNKTRWFLIEIHPSCATPTSYNPIFNSALCVLLSTL